VQFKISLFHQAFLWNAQIRFDFLPTYHTSRRDESCYHRPRGTFGR